MQSAVVNFAPHPHSVELRDVSIPAMLPDEVLVKVKAVGVCGSDLHQWAGQQSWQVNYPVTLGHEFAGMIESVGASVHGWSEGDRVVSETAAVIDPTNPMSREGRYHLDPSRKGFGYGVDGAMTSYVRVPARCLHRVPDQLPFEKAALAEPCCVAYSATVINADIKPGDRVVILGPGPIGLLCAAMARLRGASVAVVGLDQDAKRLKIAEHYGCTSLIGNAKEWAFAADGLGAEGVIDAAGASATLKHAIDIVRPNGYISKVGWGPQPLDFSLDPMVLKNITLKGSFSHNYPVWTKVLRLLTEGMLDLEPIIGGVWPLGKWQEAFETMHSGDIVKAVLSPDRTS